MENIISKELFIQKADDYRDIYCISVEKRNRFIDGKEKLYLHILSFSDTINELEGYEEPCGLFLPQGITGEGLFLAISETKAYDGITLYGGPFNADENRISEFSGSNVFCECDSEKNALDYINSQPENVYTICII